MANRPRYPFIPYIDSVLTPRTLTEVLEYREFYRVLGQSFVFIQNKKTLSDFLIEAKIQLVRRSFDVRRLDTHSHSPRSIIRRTKDRGTRRQRKPPLIVVDTTDSSVNVNKLCESIARVRQCGVWIRGYVRDLDPRILISFDALLLFDMSLFEYEILRTAICLTEKNIKALKEASNSPDLRRVLFFLNDRYQATLPFALKENPILLSV